MRASERDWLEFSPRLRLFLWIQSTYSASKEGILDTLHKTSGELLLVQYFYENHKFFSYIRLQSLSLFWSLNYM
jgi:hypothetical protein